MYNMYRMIKKQPEAIRYVIENCTEGAKEAFKLMKNKRVYIVGCGSSFHAALYGEYTLRMFGFDAQAIHAFDIINYTPPLKNSTAVVISHSWKTRTTLKALDLLKNKIPCIGITANAKANKDVDVLLRTTEYYDESDCVTMGYTTKLAALALMGESGTRKNIRRVPALVKDALETEGQVRELVDKFSSHRRFFVLGAGYNTATAFEMALKMKEGNFTDAEAMQVEQMLHGSISGVDDEDVVFLIAPKDGKALQRMYETVQALNKIEASTIAISDGAVEIMKECDHAIKTGYCEEYLNPVVSILPLQLFAYFMAEKNGINPDMTREDDIRYRRAYASIFLHLK